MSSNARSALIKRSAWVLAFGGLFAAMAWIGYTLHFTTFMLYDDEGYVLITLRDFGRHGGLYDQIFSQYGPFFYLFYDGLHRVFDFAWTNTSGRWITLVNWLGTASVCALLVHRVKAWPALTLFVFANTFAYLWIMIHEPMHPGSTITLWVALATRLGWEALRAGNMTRFAIVGGIAGTALALVKINVGAFLIMAFGAWLVFASPAARLPKAKLIIVLGGLLIPVALMRTLLVESWVQTFAIVTTCMLVATLLVAMKIASEAPARWSAWGWFIGCGVTVTALTVVCLLCNGSSLTTIWQGVIVAPLKHPNVYAFPVRWRPGVIALAVSGLALVGLLMRRPDHHRTLMIVAWIRLIAAALLQLTLLPKFAAGQAVVSLCYGLPLAGLFAWPLLKDESAKPGNLARAWLALVLVLQSLHAYPVAGSQLNWGTFLWVPLLVLGVQDAVTFLTAGRSKRLLWTGCAISTVALLLVANLLWILGWHAKQYRKNGERLEVPGAETVQLPEQVASAIRVITENAHVHADVLFSLPGAYSLNLWSGVPTPTLANTTHWFSLLNTKQQQAWMDSLQQAKRPVFVVQHNILGALIETGFRPQSPVLDYVRENYSRAFSIEGYSFWIRRDRTIAPLSTGTLHPESVHAGDHARIELTLAARSGKIAAIELWNVIDAQWHITTLTSNDAQLDMTPLGLDGRPTGEKRTTSWPLILNNLTRVGLEFNASRDLPIAASLEAVLLDEHGQRLGYARVLPANGFKVPGITPVDDAPLKSN